MQIPPHFGQIRVNPDSRIDLARNSDLRYQKDHQQTYIDNFYAGSDQGILANRLNRYTAQRQWPQYGYKFKDLQHPDFDRIKEGVEALEAKGLDILVQFDPDEPRKVLFKTVPQETDSFAPSEADGSVEMPRSKGGQNRNPIPVEKIAEVLRQAIEAGMRDFAREV